jgi:hypothetical protein
MKKKLFLFFFVVVTVTIVILPSEERVMWCASGVEMKVFNRDQCLAYFEYMGPSNKLTEIVARDFGLTALLNAEGTFHKYVLIQSLLDSNYDINVVTSNQALPLVSAVIQDNFTMFEWLLSRGADPSLSDPLTEKDVRQLLYVYLNEKPTANRHKMLELLNRS